MAMDEDNESRLVNPGLAARQWPVVWNRSIGFGNCPKIRKSIIIRIKKILMMKMQILKKLKAKLWKFIEFSIQYFSTCIKYYQSSSYNRMTAGKYSFPFAF